MSQVFSVSYDLTDPGQDYHKLIVELKRLGAWRVLYSQWSLTQANSITAFAVAEHLAKFIDANDRLLVIDITTPCATKNAVAHVKAMAYPCPKT